MTKEPIQFDDDMIDELCAGIPVRDSDGEKYPFFFAANMTTVCSPIFDDCESNYEVVDVLKSKGVITEDEYDDVELCCMFVNFRTEEQGKRFIERLNKFLRGEEIEQAEASEEIKEHVNKLYDWEKQE